MDGPSLSDPSSHATRDVLCFVVVFWLAKLNLASQWRLTPTLNVADFYHLLVRKQHIDIICSKFHYSTNMAETLSSFLSSEADLISEAAEALPHQFSNCTYALGHIRQAVYLCLTCALPRGICSSCSIACHTDHEQVELFPKRNFRCDCPTDALPHPCSLHKQLEPMSTSNKYGQNFEGKFCRCGRVYDAKKERETMIQCVACEVSRERATCFNHYSSLIYRTGIMNHV